MGGATDGASAPCIFILLATFNGANFLEPLVQSVQQQSYSNWRVLARDDCGSDGTAAMLDLWAQRDSRVTRVKDDQGRLGSATNFITLMRIARDQGAQYFAFCDQDDIWRPDKLALLITKVHELERRRTDRVPCLVWSDLRWIDERDQTMSESHFRSSSGPLALAGGGNWLLAMNLVPGCAMLGNRRLLEMAAGAAEGVRHHDWWTALIASAAGETGVVRHALVDYRLHASNQIGAATRSQRVLQLVRKPSAMLRRSAHTYWESVRQARMLMHQESLDLNPGWAEWIEHTGDKLGASAPSRRIFATLAGPVRRVGILRNLLMFIDAARRPPGP